MRERIFLRLRRFILGRFGVAVATERRQGELARLMKRRRYMYDFMVQMFSHLLKAREAGIKILEVGIGRGNFAHRLREDFPASWLVGVDPDVLTANPAASALVRADGRALPFGDRSSHITLSAFVLHHLIRVNGGDPLRDIRQLIGEALRTGEKVLLMDILGNLWTVFFASLGAIIIERHSFDFAWHTFKVMLGCLTRSELEKLTEELGLKLSIRRKNRVFPQVAILTLRTPV